MQSVTWNNALLDVFGITSGSGAIAIEATSNGGNPDLRVSSRTFTTGTAGTYGQAVPDVPTGDLDPTVYLTGIVSNANYRTNIGLVNRTSTNATASLTLVDANGGVVGQANVTVPANNFQQSPLSAFFPSVTYGSYDALSMRVNSSSSASVSAYASVIDNRSNDPIYIQGTRPEASSPLTLAAVGRAPGAAGTYWRSDVTMYNPNNYPLSIGIRYRAASVDDNNASIQYVNVGAGRTLVLDDILSRIGISSGSGALDLIWSGGGPVVTSRTYTTGANGGTYGQSIDPVEKWANDVFVPGVRSDASYRSNVGFVNNGTQTMGVSVSLIAQSGLTIANAFVSIPARSQVQTSLASLFPSVNLASLGPVTLQAHTDGSASLFAYGSIIDNISGDPVYFAGK